MTIPSYEDIMLPLLNFASNEEEFTPTGITNELLKFFPLSQSEKKKFLPGGQILVFYDRVGWAIKHLRHAGLITRKRRGIYQVTPRGLSMLKENPIKLDRNILIRFPSFVKYISRKQR